MQDHLTKMNLPWEQERVALDAEFWADARAELGYGEFLTAEGVSALEYRAYEEGHSAGYSEIYNCLLGLVPFVETIARCVKPKKEG